MPSAVRNQGFTLVEILVVVAALAILAGIAVPSYLQYLQRSRLAAAFERLSLFALRMEQSYQDNGNYGLDVCSVPVPAATEHFAFSCELSQSGQGYTATATGQAVMSGFAYSIDHTGTRRTLSYPGAQTLPAACWLLRPADC